MLVITLAWFESRELRWQHLRSNFLNPPCPSSLQPQRTTTTMGIPPLPNRHHNITGAVPPSPPPTATHSHHRSFLHFYWGTHAEILFSGWPGNNKGMYALALIFVFFLAVFVEMFSNINLVKPGSKRVGLVILQTVIHGFRAGFAFMVMLAVMSYNGGVFIAAVLGHAVGYVIFGSPVFKKGSTNN